MIVGFTGTRKGMTQMQQDQLALALSCFYNPAGANELHVGGAAGADDEAWVAAEAAGYDVHVHPCPGVVRDDLQDGAVWHETFPPLERNRHIVAASDILVAAARTNTEEQRSGTWATVRYARDKGIPIVMLSRGIR